MRYEIEVEITSIVAVRPIKAGRKIGVGTPDEHVVMEYGEQEWRICTNVQLAFVSPVQPSCKVGQKGRLILEV